MQKIKSERGITLLILIITIVVLALISIPIIVNTTDISELQRYTYFKGDIDKLRESIETTYADLDDLSSIGPIYTGDYSFLSYVQGSDQVANPNDGNVYYVISLSILNSYINTYFVSQLLSVSSHIYYHALIIHSPIFIVHTLYGSIICHFFFFLIKLLS